MKRVLIITYYWPPTGGSGVQRWLKFAKYLPQYGWQPVIFTPSNPEQLVRDEYLESEIPPQAEVIKLPIIEPYGIYRKLTGGKGVQKEVNVVRASDNASAVQKLSMWARGNLFVPDPRCLWIRPAARFLKKYLAAHPVDAMVTTGPPHSMHLIGRELKRALGIPWIADFRDPWTEIFYFKHITMSQATRQKQRRLEQSVLDEADCVVAVSPLVQKDFTARTGTPVRLVTNGWDKADFPGIGEETQTAAGEHFTVVHTGLFAADGNPETFWDILKELCDNDADFRRRLQIRLVGKTDRQVTESIRMRGLQLEDLGYSPHDVAVREQRNASVLMLPLRKEPEYKAVLPGKLFEYLASGRPVIGIGEPQGAMAAILSESGCGKTFGWDDALSMRNELVRLWEQYLQNGKTESNSPEKILRYERSRLCGSMAGLLEGISSGPALT